MQSADSEMVLHAEKLCSKSLTQEEQKIKKKIKLKLVRFP